MKNKILIVEDEFIVANSLRLILEQAGYHVNGIAASAEEAEENLQQHQTDLVLLDIRLDGKQSGIDIGRKLRSENIPFVYLSANSSQKILEEAKATEPYGFLVKPFREKDLLVTLDIAWYRHKHGLETKLRQEELLNKQLTGVLAEKTAAKEKLFKIFRILQSHIPFDLILSLSEPLNFEHMIDTGYLRTGFEEYQFISDKELLTITGLKRNALSLIIKNCYNGPDGIVFNDETDGNAYYSSLQKILFDYFKTESYLCFPVVLSNGSTVRFLFCSRQRGVYTRNNIALLNRLRTGLADIAENMLHGEMLPASGLHQPAADKRTKAAHHPQFNDIIGSHPLLLAALDLTILVAPHNTSVLILGESGTGKERVAQSIHLLSKRKNGPFIKVNCAAIPSALIESELFGHEKGAFTGAIEKRKGKFELAHGGTIFLDEIGEIPLDMQVKLLRVLQEKEIETVGGSSSRSVDVRIVAATNRNLEKEIADGNFRLDLYYRLNVFPITLPPLRDRRSDIPSLATFFAHKFCREFNKEFNGITPGMTAEMLAYSWPGNIRELENVIERAVILNDGHSELEIKPNLSGAFAEQVKPVIETLENVKKVQRETEKEYILSVLKKANGRIRGANGAAELLNMKPTTLESKMLKLGIKKNDW